MERAVRAAKSNNTMAAPPKNRSTPGPTPLSSGSDTTDASKRRPACLYAPVLGQTGQEMLHHQRWAHGVDHETLYQVARFDLPKRLFRLMRLIMQETRSDNDKVKLASRLLGGGSDHALVTYIDMGRA